jgi:DNA-binding IclR family transcriptional regulator
MSIRTDAAPGLVALYARTGQRPVNLTELSEAIGCPRSAASYRASALVVCGYLERGPARGTYWVAIEAIPTDGPTPPPRAVRQPRPAEFDAPDLTGQVFAADLAVLDALDAAGVPMLPADIRRALGVQSSLGRSLQRLQAAGLVCRVGAAWSPV